MKWFRCNFSSFSFNTNIEFATILIQMATWTMLMSNLSSILLKQTILRIVFAFNLICFVDDSRFDLVEILANIYVMILNIFKNSGSFDITSFIWLSEEYCVLYIIWIGCNNCNRFHIYIKMQLPIISMSRNTKTNISPRESY